MSAIRDLILAADDLPIEAVPVPEWPKVGTVHVRTLSAIEYDDFEDETINRRKESGESFITNYRARLAALCVVDPVTRARAFTDEDAAALGKKSVRAMNRIVAAAQRLNGVNEKELEAIAKNSESTPDASQPSA